MEVGRGGGETEEVVCGSYGKRPYRGRGDRVGFEDFACG